jgi:superfamily I DNA/RNA helicase
VELPASLQERLARLAPDQREAATAPLGPVLCVAPAGSGKTTTLVARVAWLVATGVPPAEITAVTFNRRAAAELSERLEAALDWLDDEPPTPDPGAAERDRATPREGASKVRVRTFHALGLEILRSIGRPLPELLAREPILRSIRPEAERADLAKLDAAISRMKLDLDVTPAQVAADPEAGPLARAFVDYEAALEAAGGMDFDDLVRLSLRALEADPALFARWRTACAHLLVDETQDVDRSQLRLVLLLAAPANRIFLVGDDDQSIYGWRLADVRRVLGLADQLPGLRRIDLEVNYRCPAVVLERAARLVEHNRERFAKSIRPGPSSEGELVLAPEPGDEEVRATRLIDHWGERDGSRAILARTNRELLPAAAVALAMGMPFRAPALQLLVENPAITNLLARVRRETDPALPLLVRIGRIREQLRAEGLAPSTPLGSPEVTNVEVEPDDAVGLADLAAALLGWAVRFPDLDALEAAILAARDRLGDLRHDDAALTLATAHATKGLEFDHVAVIGMDDGRFPSARSLVDAEDPDRALEEERRLAYVAWTRARRSLALVYDPAAPSRFLLEAFSSEELALDPAAATALGPAASTIADMPRKGDQR